METWLKATGAVGLDDPELANFPVTGRGTVGHAYTDSLLGPALRSARPPLSIEDTLATYILFVRSRKSGYDDLRRHVAALPTSYSSSIFFAECELEVCAGTSQYNITKQLERQIEDDYKRLVVGVLVRYRDLFPLESFSIEDYKWALCTVWSRAMDFELPDGTSIRLLAPFADMLNHSPEVKQCHVHNASSKSLSILAGKDYEAGDQVFINYGPKPNSRFLHLHGFVLPGTPNDNYDLVLTSHPEAPFFEQKHKLWVSAGLDSTSTISLTLTDPLLKNILRYLRIQRSSESELAAIALHQIDATEKISDVNEVEVLRFLVESFCSLLDGFRTQLERLEEQLAEGVSPSGGRVRSLTSPSTRQHVELRLLGMPEMTRIKRKT